LLAGVWCPFSVQLWLYQRRNFYNNQYTTAKLQPTSRWLNVQFIKLVCMSTTVNKNKPHLPWSTSN